jgi:hypothetical protein
MATYVNESSTMNVRARFYDSGNAPVTPSSVRYLIRDISNNRVVKDWTTLTPDEDISFQVDAADNDIYQRRFRLFERRVITIQANAGEAGQFAQEVEYYVRNLFGLVG